MSILNKTNGRLTCPYTSCSLCYKEKVIAKVDESIYNIYLNTIKNYSVYIANEESSKNLSNDKLQNIKNDIEKILCPTCPNCDQVWIDNEACMHVTCSKCSVSFCGFCSKIITEGLFVFLKDK